MDRRSFLTRVAGVASAAIAWPLAASPSAISFKGPYGVWTPLTEPIQTAPYDAVPPISYLSIPATDTDKVDCLQSTGYYGGRIIIDGKQYSVLYSAPEHAYKKLGRHAVEKQLRALVDQRLRNTFQMIRGAAH